MRQPTNTTLFVSLTCTHTAQDGLPLPDRALHGCGRRLPRPRHPVQRPGQHRGGPPRRRRQGPRPAPQHHRDEGERGGRRKDRTDDTRGGGAGLPGERNECAFFLRPPAKKDFIYTYNAIPKIAFR